MLKELESTASTLDQEIDIDSAPVIYDDFNDDSSFFNFFDSLMQQAIYQRASDIHIEPSANHYRIRLRLQGILNELCVINKDLATRLIMRIKIMSNLNIAEKRLPQDGYLLIYSENKIECRVNICPTSHGEKLVIRINHAKYELMLLEKLGLLPFQIELLKKSLTQPQGLILVTGPTGSGKTMTLYSLLNYLNEHTRNIITIEDPIESDIEGLNQIQINKQIDLDFNNILRCILRQDPDVIMVGEIRDSETAHLVMQTALTGHLVFSTLHNHQAIDVIKRLSALGVDLNLYADAITLIIAQRLVRKLCDHCKIENKIKPLIKNFSIDIATSYQAVGCCKCSSGYKGRIGLFELLPYSKLKINCQNTNLLYQSLAKQMAENKWQHLLTAAIEKIKSGETSYEEVRRVIGDIS